MPISIFFREYASNETSFVGLVCISFYLLWSVRARNPNLAQRRTNDQKNVPATSSKKDWPLQGGNMTDSLSAGLQSVHCVSPTKEDS